MITYQFHSEPLGCDLQFKFGLNGRIIGFVILGENNMTSEHERALFSKMFSSVGEMLQYCKKKNIQVTEIKPDLSFDAFWNRYNYKEGGSKKKATAIWDRMSEKDKAAALNWIPKYENILIRQGVAKMYGTTYLNEKRWE